MYLSQWEILSALKREKFISASGQCKRSTDRWGGPVGTRPGARHKTGLVGERELQPYAPHGAERNKCYISKGTM